MLAHLAAIGGDGLLRLRQRLWPQPSSRLGIAPAADRATGPVDRRQHHRRPDRASSSTGRAQLPPMPGVETWLAILAFAVLSTSLAFIIYFRLLASAGRHQSSCW